MAENGGTRHLVKQGECIESIAFKHGFHWRTIWEDPGNAQLNRTCMTPNILKPGDEVYIPQKRTKSESCLTEQRHRFKLKGVPSKVQLRLVDAAGNLRTGLSYKLEVQDGPTYQGKIPEDGWIKHSIPPEAKAAKLELVAEEFTEEYVLQLGGLDPIYELTGVQQRLQNLGYSLSDPAGVFGPATEAALRNFQAAHGLIASGEADSPTLDMLLEIYGC